MKSLNKPSFNGVVTYDKDGREFAGGGPVQWAYACRKGDGFVSLDELRIVAGPTDANRNQQLRSVDLSFLRNFSPISRLRNPRKMSLLKTTIVALLFVMIWREPSKRQRRA